MEQTGARTNNHSINPSHGGRVGYEGVYAIWESVMRPKRIEAERELREERSMPAHFQLEWTADETERVLANLNRFREMCHDWSRMKKRNRRPPACPARKLEKPLLMPV
jgi:hypothetical protein